MQVSDGKDVGEWRVLRIVASPLRVAKVANTGLVVARGGARLLTAANLSFITNAAAYQVGLYDTTRDAILTCARKPT